MEIYLLKSVGCLLLLLAFYKVFLENTSMHNLKRAYLLMTVIAPLTLPLITFTTYTEVNSLSEITSIPVLSVTASETGSAFPWEMVLWGIYLAGVMVFGVRFILRLQSMFRKIRKNPKQRYDNIFKVLLQQEVCPHTFLSYIFLNQKAHQQKEIPEIVLVHEMVHARERHSLDILLLELVKVIFWFNPLFWILGKSIKLNHEFLADRGVVTKGVSATEYQKTILAYSSHVSAPQMAHSINYSSLKKRFTVMKTKSSKKSIWLRSMLLLPLIAIMLISFTTQKEVYRERPDLKQGARTMIETSHPDRSDFKRWEDQGKYVLTLDGKYISASELNEYHPDDLPFYNETITSEGKVLVSIMTSPYWQSESGINFGTNEQQTSATREEMKEYNKLARKYNAMDKEERIVTLKELKRMEYIYRKMSDKQRADAEPFPECIPPPPPPPPAPDAEPNAPDAPDAAGSVPPPPPPPDPVKDFDKMINKGEKFYLNGKEISKKQARALKNQVSELKSINVVRENNGTTAVYFVN